MLKSLLLLIIFQLVIYLNYAQINYDSLLVISNNKKLPDSTRVKALLGYLVKFENIKSDSLIFYADKICSMSLKNELKKYCFKATQIKGNHLFNKGNYKDAIALFQEAQEGYKSLNMIIEYSDIMTNVGSSYDRMGQYKDALTFHTQSLEIKNSIGDKEGTARAYNNMGNSYFSLGNTQEGLRCHKTALEIYTEIDDKQGMANANGNLAFDNANLGNYSEALEYYLKSIVLLEELGNVRRLLSSYNGIGNLYKDRGNLEDALKNYELVLKIALQLGDNYSIATAHNNIGLVYFRQKKHDIALENHTISLRIRTEMGDKKGIAGSYNNIGNIYGDLGKYDLAIDYFTKATAIQKEIGNKSSLAMAFSNLGNAYYKIGKYTESVQFANQGLITAKSSNAFRAQKFSQRQLYFSYEKLNQIDSALHYLNSLKKSFENELNNNYFTVSEKEKEMYFAMLEEDFGYYFDFAAKHHKTYENCKDTAYNLALQYKGLSLKSSTAMRNTILNSKDSSLIKQYEDWIALKLKISKSYELGKETNELEEEARKIEQDLIKKSIDFNDFNKLKQLNWKDIQNELKPNEAAIEFVHFKSEIDTLNPIIYIALIITKNCLHPEIITLCSESELKSILGNFQGNNLGFVTKVYGTRNKAQKDLYQKVWKPLEKHLKGIHQIYYSPSGLLHKVSFSALTSDDGVYISENYMINQRSSTSNIALKIPQIIHPSDSYFIVGGVKYSADSTKNQVWDYLPGTLTESNKIVQLLTKKKSEFVHYYGDLATESIFKEYAQKNQIIHIASHGFFFPSPEDITNEMEASNEKNVEEIIFRGTKPIFDSINRTSYANTTFLENNNPLMRSGFVLAGANNVWNRKANDGSDDGVFTAHEVSNLNLRNTKLVVLSACETGLGDIKGSEGVFGLQRAFKMAGAEYLIMSLWQVPDKETAEFMELFYKTLVKVKDIPKAFNLTQQAMRKKYDPYYWAAFVLIN